jgi:hypothetical protein
MTASIVRETLMSVPPHRAKITGPVRIKMEISSVVVLSSGPEQTVKKTSTNAGTIPARTRARVKILPEIILAHVGNFGLADIVKST